LQDDTAFMYLAEVSSLYQQYSSSSHR